MWHDVRALNATASGLMALVVIACLASGVWWVSQRPMFTLRTIRVDSLYDIDLKHVNTLTLRQGVLGKFKGNFFTTNLEQVRNSFESVPWVRRATVRREWPNELIVELEEHETLGTWGDDGRLLSVKGEVFTANLAEADEDHPLPQFAGPEGSEKDVLARYADFRAAFAPLKLAPEQVELSSRYAWTVKLNNGTNVAFGRENDRTILKQRLARLIGIYPQLTARIASGIDTIDMRYPNGLALSASGLNVPADASKPIKTVAKKPSTSKTTSKHI